MCSAECGNDVDYALCHACDQRAKELAFKRGFDAGEEFGKKAETPKAKVYRLQRDELIAAMRGIVNDGCVSMPTAMRRAALALIADLTKVDRPLTQPNPEHT